MTRVIVALLLSSCAFAQEQAAQGLPVKRVVLYKNGVGYFEHLGTVRGNQQVAISFTSGQLNDVLKSLTALDLGGGRITGVGYGSAAPLDRELGDLRLPVGEKTSLTEFLGALRGAKIEVRNGTNTITGRLLSVERKTRTGGGTTLEVDYLALITDSGEVRTTEVSPTFSVRLLEPGLTGKVGRYLDLMSSGREPDTRKMLLSTEGTGERSLFVSYISEVPVWKSTYRVVLDSKNSKGPLLQGWAIVDNTVGQDWDKVQLSLVAGAPQSFVQNISQPYYARRPVVPVTGALNSAPQTYESTLIPGGARITGTVTDPAGAALSGARVMAFNERGDLVGQTYANTSGAYALQGVPDGSVRLQFEQPGFRSERVMAVASSSGAPLKRDVTLNVGSLAESVDVRGEAPTLQASSSSVAGGAGGRNLGSGSMLGGNAGYRKSAPASTGQLMAPEAIRARTEPAAQGQELGDLFEYKLKEPITIQKNRSALVPIVQSAIGAEKVSVWNEQAGLPRPQRALWITNTSGLTLDGGSFSVLEEETFAGEGIFDPIRPGEKRLAGYAVDLALNVSSKLDSDSQRVTRVRIAKGIMTQESEIRERKTYTFRNQDASARTVLVEHPVRAGYELHGTSKPEEITAGLMRFRLAVPPAQTEALTIEEVRPIQSTVQISNLNSSVVAGFVSARSIDKGIESALEKILVQKDLTDELDSQKEERDEEMKSIFEDQQRLRENMKALKGTAEEKALTQRYTQELNQQESRVEELRKEMKELETKEARERDKLSRMIEALSFDVKL